MVRRLFAIHFSLALLLVFLVGCTSITGKSLGRHIDDATITASVKAKLAGESLSTLTRIDVDTNQGIVFLNGNVEDTDTKKRVVNLARQVKGVRGVVDNLRVQDRR